MGPHRRLLGEGAHAHRDQGDAHELGIEGDHVLEGVFEFLAVVDAGTDHDLRVDLDAGAQELAQPAQARGPPGIAQHIGPQLRIRGVDRHVQRRELLVDHALQVELGEAGEGGVVAVEEGQAKVVVLDVEGAAEPLGQLVDEAEGAVVVAGADAVEDGRIDRDAQGLTLGLGDGDLVAQGSALSLEHQGHLGGVDQLLVFDDVGGFAPVDRHQLVTDGDVRSRGGRRSRD